jgi:hypothetical protein
MAESHIRASEGCSPHKPIQQNLKNKKIKNKKKILREILK